MVICWLFSQGDSRLSVMLLLLFHCRCPSALFSLSLSPTGGDRAPPAGPETSASSSPLSDEQDEAELMDVSMATIDSESWGHCGDEGGEEDEDEEEDELQS